MSEQLLIPNEAKCQRCGLEAKTSHAVYESFGVRMVNQKLLTQSHCKKCRKQSLPKELREKYKAWKEQQHERLANDTLKAKEGFDKQFIENREIYKKEQDTITEQIKQTRNKLQEEFNKDCEKKKQELEASMK